MLAKPEIKYLFCLLIVSGFCKGQIPSYVPLPGLQGWWSFTSNANDNSVNNYSGVVNGAVLTSDRFGNANSAYLFNGSSDFISTNYQGVLGNKARTVSFWAKTPNASAGMSAVAWGDNQFNPNTGKKFGCHFNIFTSGLTIDGADAAITYQSPCNHADDQWHHYVFKMDSADLMNQIDIYMDGIPVTTVVFNFNGSSTMVTVNNYPVYFGRLGLYSIPAVPPYYFQGSLDDIGIWDRALSPAEINNLYYNGAATGIVNYTAFCSSSAAILTAPLSQSYSWSTGATSQSITVNNPGTYWVQLQNGCNTNQITDTFHVSFVASPGIDTVNASVCQGSSYTLPDGNVVSVGGSYTDTISTVAGCDSIVVVTNLSVTPFTGTPVSVTVNANDTITLGESVVLSASGANTFIWDNGISVNTITVTPADAGNFVYCVSGTNGGGCIDTECVKINVLECPQTFIPSAFSPNGDHVNDELCLYGVKCLTSFLLSIYDRWGEKVFESSDPDFCWNGVYKGKELNSGVFAYFFKGTLLNGEVISRSGNISLVK